MNAFSAFSGFEGAATLGEESKRTTRTIPAAITWSLVGSAAIYIVFTWIANNAFPSAGALAASPAPFVQLATANIGSAMGNRGQHRRGDQRLRRPTGLHQRGQPAGVRPRP